MGLTFPWEPRCLDFNCCCSPCQRLGGASVFRRSSASSQASHSSLNLTLILVFVCESLEICFTYGARVSGCLFESGNIYLYYLPSLPPVCGMNFYCSQTHISNYTGTSSDEQDEFAMSFWPNHSQTTHGKLLYTITECKALSKCVNVKTFALKKKRSRC